MPSAKILRSVLLFTVIAGLIGTASAFPFATPISAAPAPAPQGRMVTVPAGTSILVRMLDTVDSSKSSPAVYTGRPGNKSRGEWQRDRAER